jgi:hypothetical protein
MKNKQNSIKRTVFIILVFFSLAVLPKLGEDLKDLPSSIRYVTGLKVDDSTIEELPGANITEFRMYFTAKNSYILWKLNKEFFIYTLSDSDHIRVASQLFQQIEKHGITTFAAYRDGKKIRFNKYRKVLAIQVQALNQGQLK